MHRALSLDHIKGLVRVVAVHVIPVAGVGVDVNPSVELRRIENYLSLFTVMCQFDKINDLESIPFLVEIV